MEQLVNLVASLPAANLFDLLDQHEVARFDIDKRHIALRLEMDWVIYRRLPDGWLKQLDRWTGSRRSIRERLERHGIEMSHAAEAQIDAMAERTGFREIEEETIDT